MDKLSRKKYIKKNCVYYKHRIDINTYDISVAKVIYKYDIVVTQVNPVRIHVI